jgi:hypothetical protein
MPGPYTERLFRVLEFIEKGRGVFGNTTMGKRVKRRKE